MTFRRRHAFGLGVVLTGVLAGAVVLFLPSRKIAPDRHLAALPGAARTALTAQMHAHPRGMTDLMMQVALLDYPGATATARALLAEPPVARPAGAEAGQLPERFFQLQDELRAHLQEAAAAATARDANALAEAYGAAARTCVRCHDAYLTGK